jgi:hypothetical protein
MVCGRGVFGNVFIVSIVFWNMILKVLLVIFFVVGG